MMVNKHQPEKKPAVRLNPLGQARYSIACGALYYVEDLLKAVDYYDEPRLKTIMLTLKTEGDIGSTDYYRVMTMYRTYRSKFVELVGEDKYNAIMLEYDELEGKRTQLEQEASNQKEGHGSVIYE